MAHCSVGSLTTFGNLCLIKSNFMIHLYKSAALASLFIATVLSPRKFRNLYNNSDFMKKNNVLILRGIEPDL